MRYEAIYTKITVLHSIVLNRYACRIISDYYKYKPTIIYDDYTYSDM